MFSWRRRIGYITPSVMETAAYEFYRFAPEGIGLVAVSCNIEDWKSDEYERGLKQIDARADDLASRAVTTSFMVGVRSFSAVDGAMSKK